jgi:hypothetical protein
MNKKMVKKTEVNYKKFRFGKYIISSNWKLLLVIIILLLIALLSLYLGLKKPADNIKKCSSNDDCVKIDVGCCPCSSGGEERCGLKYEIIDIIKNRGDCSQVMCAQVYNCHINECKCIKGECKEA